MNIEQHHITKLLSAHRHGFAARGQIGASQNTLNDLCSIGYFEARQHQPDKRTKAETRYYLTDTGRAFVEPIAKHRAAQAAEQERERLAKETLEAAAPDLLEALRNIVANAELKPDLSEEWQGTVDAYVVPIDDIDAARAAIAKAEKSLRAA